VIGLLLKEVLKRYRKEFEYLAVGQKATIARLWNVGLYGMRYRIGLYVERSE
jgi:hypothetical protein